MGEQLFFTGKFGKPHVLTFEQQTMLIFPPRGGVRIAVNEGGGMSPRDSGDDLVLHLTKEPPDCLKWAKRPPPGPCALANI